jgi:multidrug resistance efflux pump
MPQQRHLYPPPEREERSDESQLDEILSYKPGFMVRKGTALFGLVVLLMIVLSCIIRYPDVIYASARLKAERYPKMVTARQEGKLTALLVENEQAVQPGQVLAYFESTASHKQVVALKKWLDNHTTAIENNNLPAIIHSKLPILDSLGEIQGAYQQFENTSMQTLQTLEGGYFERKRLALEKDLQLIDKVQQANSREIDLTKEDNSLQKKEYEAYKTLAEERIVAPLELNEFKGRLIAKEKVLQQLETQSINNAITKHSKQKEFLELQKSMADQQQTFRSAFLDLRSTVEQWMQKHIAIAPEHGKVIFASALQENQFLKTGQELFYIQPRQNLFYAELKASQTRLGMLKNGQKVLIHIESFPSNEFGFLEGSVQYISSIPNNQDSFLINVDLSKGLITNNNYRIAFRNGLSGRAQIITENKRLITQLTGNLRKTFERH